MIYKPINLSQRLDINEINWPKPPDDWVAPEPNRDKGEIMF